MAASASALRTRKKKPTTKAPSTPATPSTRPAPVEAVEPVEGQTQPDKPAIDWFQERPLHQNFLVLAGYQINKRADRWEGKHVSRRYVFTEVRRMPNTNANGVVLEESQAPAITLRQAN